MLTADRVQPRQHLVRRHGLPVDGHHVAMREGERQLQRRIRRFARVTCPAPHRRFGLGPGIFQLTALIGDVQCVGIHGVRRTTVLLACDRNAIGLGIGDELFARVQIPEPPRRNDLDVRLERVSTQLEAHLVVALAGCAMRNGITTGLLGNLDQPTRDQWAGNRSPQQILALVNRIGAEHREYVIAHEGLAQVFDEDLLDAQGLCLGPYRFNLLALTEVCRKGHDRALVAILQPFENHRRVQTAGIREYDLAGLTHVLARCRRPTTGRAKGARV